MRSAHPLSTLPDLTPLDKLLKQLSERASDPAVRRWAAALAARGESASCVVEARPHGPGESIVKAR
jgi:hypothetical protein